MFNFFKKGFSQLEIIIFVVVMVVLSLFAVGSLQKYYQQTVLEAFVQRLEGDLNFYRSLAMSENVDIEVYFSSNDYQIIKENKNLKIINYPKDIEIDVAKVGFKPSGAAKYAGSIIVSYQNKKKQKLTVVPGSGLIIRARL